MAEMRVEIYSHYFVVRDVTPRNRPALEGFSRRYIQFGLVRENGRYFRAPLRVFAAATAARTEYRFHINTLEEFKRHILLAEYRLTEPVVEWVTMTTPQATAISLAVREGWVLRDYQEPAVEYIVAPPPPRAKFISLQTGKGKSLIAMMAAAQLGQRFALIVRPSYIEKWLIDFNKTYNEEIAECLLVIQGSAQLQALLQMAALGELDGNKIILFSNKTLQNWIKLYEQNGAQILEQGYACLPDQLFEFLGVGVRIIDEVHQDFHLNFKLDLYTHVERSISLSATLLSEDDFLNNMYELAYPKGERFNGIAYDKYIDARAALYSFNDPRKIRVTEYGSKTYSHHAFEKSILRSESTTAAYFDMIRQVANGTFFKNYKPGQRLLVYCSSINMCTKLADYLRMQYPRLVINRYVEDDPYDYVMESDICVSTLQSAGTNIDIPNLTTVIMTPAVRSSAANIQGFGRLRKPADDTPVMFIYFVCQDFPKHTKYHEIKKVLLEERARTFKEEYLGRPI